MCIEKNDARGKVAQLMEVMDRLVGALQGLDARLAEIENGTVVSTLGRGGTEAVLPLARRTRGQIGIARK